MMSVMIHKETSDIAVKIHKGLSDDAGMIHKEFSADAEMVHHALNLLVDTSPAAALTAARRRRLTAAP